MLKLEKVEFMFGDDHRKMLDYLEDEIRKTPCLSFLNNPNIQGADLKIYTDASNTAIGGFITITGKDGIEYPLAFHSRTFSDQ
jgi:hypothetical protein